MIFEIKAMIMRFVLAFQRAILELVDALEMNSGIFIAHI